MGSLVPIITKCIIGNNRYILTYYWQGQLGDAKDHGPANPYPDGSQDWCRPVATWLPGPGIPGTGGPWTEHPGQAIHMLTEVCTTGHMSQLGTLSYSALVKRVRQGHGSKFQSDIRRKNTQAKVHVCKSKLLSSRLKIIQKKDPGRKGMQQKEW